MTLPAEKSATPIFEANFFAFNLRMGPVTGHFSPIICLNQMTRASLTDWKVEQVLSRFDVPIDPSSSAFMMESFILRIGPKVDEVIPWLVANTVLFTFPCLF